MFKPAEAHSKLFHLNPGIRTSKGEALTECVVRLLTRADIKEIAREPEASRDDAALARHIVRIGDVTESSSILLAVAELVSVDELRIRTQVAEFEAECLKPADAVKPVTRPPLRETDIAGEVFTLSPGPLIHGARATACRVRLLTRAENKIIEAQADPEVRDDLFFLFAIIQLGNHTQITQEHIDALTLDDAERIGDAYTELRAQYAPDSKSGE